MNKIKNEKYDIVVGDSEIKGFYVYNKPRAIVNAKDRRKTKYKKFKKENGFTPDEAWNLYISIAIFVLPRLKYFREHTIGIPLHFKTIEEWYNILDQMIFSFENVLKYDDFMACPSEYIKKYRNKKKAVKEYYNDLNKGFKLFGEYLIHLWW